MENLQDLGIFDGFYLAGGTALTIKYDHRISEDFDFFLLPDKKKDFMQILHLVDNKILMESQKDTLIFTFKEVKFSFFEYSYPLLVRPQLNKKIKILIASDQDIACMKSIAIIQRGEKKDFFDLWFLMRQNKWNLENIIALNLKKYGDNFNPALFLKSLIYFEDAESAMIKDIDRKWLLIKDYFRQIVKDYMNK